MELSSVEQKTLNSYMSEFNDLSQKIVGFLDEGQGRNQTMLNLEQSWMWFERSFMHACLKSRQAEEQKMADKEEAEAEGELVVEEVKEA